MLKINLIAIGDIKEKYLLDAIAEYSKRISRFAELKIVELKENNPKSSSQKDIDLALEKDAQNIEKHIKGYSICLDIDAPQYTSPQFAKKSAILLCKPVRYHLLLVHQMELLKESSACVKKKYLFLK